MTLDTIRSAHVRSTLVILAVLTGPACAEDAQRFGDWTAACRDDGYCWTKTTASDGPDTGDLFRIGRHAEGIYWEVSLTAPTAPADPAARITVTVDTGEPQPFDGPAEIAAYGSQRDIFFTGKGIQTVMDRITPGAELTIDYTSADGTARRATFPLAGLNAALIWIDGEQNRIGSERVAEAPPLDRVPVADLPDLVPPALLAQRAADTDCTPLADLPTAGDITVDPGIGDGMVLYILPCWAAAENAGWKAYVSPDGRVFTGLALPEYTPESGWTAMTHLLNIAYDAAERTLAAGYRGRPDGGCGTEGLWRWQPYDFRLVEFRAQPDCAGEGNGGTALPLVWPEPAPAN